jgi:hypothetical protein
MVVLIFSSKSLTTFVTVAYPAPSPAIPHFNDGLDIHVDDGFHRLHVPGNSWLYLASTFIPESMGHVLRDEDKCVDVMRGLRSMSLKP